MPRGTLTRMSDDNPATSPTETPPPSAQDVEAAPESREPAGNAAAPDAPTGAAAPQQEQGDVPAGELAAYDPDAAPAPRPYTEDDVTQEDGTDVSS